MSTGREPPGPGTLAEVWEPQGMWQRRGPPRLSADGQLCWGRGRNHHPRWSAAPAGSDLLERDWAGMNRAVRGAHSQYVSEVCVQVCPRCVSRCVPRCVPGVSQVCVQVCIPRCVPGVCPQLCILRCVSPGVFSRYVSPGVHPRFVAADHPTFEGRWKSGLCSVLWLGHAEAGPTPWETSVVVHTAAGDI